MNDRGLFWISIAFIVIAMAIVAFFPGYLFP